MKILFKISIVLSLFSALLFTSGFSASNDNIQFIKTNWVENSEGVIIVNSHKELLEYYNVNLKKFSLGPREKIASDSTIGFANAIEKYDEEYFKNSSIIIVILEENSKKLNYDLTVDANISANKNTVVSLGGMENYQRVNKFF